MQSSTSEEITKVFEPNPPLLIKLASFGKRRKFEEVDNAVAILVEKQWYAHHTWMIHDIEDGRDSVDAHNPEIFQGACEEARAVEAKYGAENLVWTDFEWGVLKGKLSALRWLLGDDWDMFDN